MAPDDAPQISKHFDVLSSVLTKNLGEAIKEVKPSLSSVGEASSDVSFESAGPDSPAAIDR